MTKKFLSVLTLTVALFAGANAVNAENVNGWNITNSGSGTAEICTDYAYDGVSALHVSGVGEDGDITVSHPMNEIQHIQRIYRVTFFAKGEYEPANIQVGWGNRTTGNALIIDTLPVSHEKVETEDAGDGWTKYSYTVKQNTGANKVENNTNFTLTFKNASGDIYIDGVSIVYDDSYDKTKDTEGYKVTGKGILSDGSFEKRVTADTDEAVEDYGWTVNNPNTSGLVAAADTSLETLARVIFNQNNERSMFVKYNAFNNIDNAKALVLSKAVDISDINVYVTLDIKGTYLPSSVLIGGKDESSYQALAGGGGSSYDNPYGGLVTAQKLPNGFTRYKVKAAVKNDKIIIKILGDCLGMYIDNISVTNLDGEAIAIVNGDFDSVEYDEEDVFAEGFEKLSMNERAFVQRVSFNKNWTAYIKTSDRKVGFAQEIANLDTSEYTVCFDAFSVGKRNDISVGFANDIDDFKSGTVLRDMDKEDIGGGWYRYSTTLTKIGSKLVFVNSGECTGLYIDNISIKAEDGTELVKNGNFELKTQPSAYYVGKIKLLKDNKEVENISAGKHKAVVSVENNFCEDMDFTIILCQVREGKLISYKKNTVTLSQNGDEDIPTQLDCELNISDYAEGDILEVYIWDNTENITSLSSYCVFGQEN